jgi:hypothetical protein
VKHESFYSTAAQVIPVLWIVLVFQLKLFGEKAEREGASSVEAEEVHRSANLPSLLVIVGTGLAFWLAEGLALDALLSEEDSGFSRGWIRVTLTLGLFFVFYIPVFPWFEALIERTPLEPLRQRWFGWLDRRRERRSEQKSSDPSA